MRLPEMDAIGKEVKMLTTRSGGPGGQHVNKVETKVVLRWNVRQSSVLSALQKEIFTAKHRNRMNSEGELVISSDVKRSQLKNKQLVLKKLEVLLSRAFVRRKKRIPTVPGKATKKKRLHDKRRQSEKKELRRRIQ